MTKRSLLSALGTVALVAAGFLFPTVVSSLYLIHLANLGVITVIVTVGLNLLTGYAGQISIGHAAFYSVGAYTAAILAVHLHAPFLVTLPAAAAVAGVMGWIIGRPTLRLKGAYLAMATIGIGEIVQLVALNWTDLTGGAQGLKGVPSPVILGVDFGSERNYFYLVFTVALAIYWVTNRLIDSEVGRAWRAIKDNELAAQVMGVDVSRMKTLAFVISTAIAGIAGALYAHLMNYVSPYGFGFRESVAFLCMALAGGLGWRWGPIFGVVLLTAGRESFRAFNDYQLVVYGLLLIGVIVFMPKGIVGTFDSLIGSLKRRWATGG